MKIQMVLVFSALFLSACDFSPTGRLPQIPGSRIVSHAVNGIGGTEAVFMVSGTADVVLDAYRRELAKQGWTLRTERPGFLGAYSDAGAGMSVDFVQAGEGVQIEVYVSKGDI